MEVYEIFDVNCRHQTGKKLLFFLIKIATSIVAILYGFAQKRNFRQCLTRSNSTTQATKIEFHCITNMQAVKDRNPVNWCSWCLSKTPCKYRAYIVLRLITI